MAIYSAILVVLAEKNEFTSPYIINVPSDTKTLLAKYPPSNPLLALVLILYSISSRSAIFLIVNYFFSFEFSFIKVGSDNTKIHSYLATNLVNFSSIYFK